MREMKYVVVDIDDKERLFIFPKEINHDDFADILHYLKVWKGREWERDYRKPLSAGFTDGNQCYGMSETLKLSSRPQDTLLLFSGVYDVDNIQTQAKEL